MGLFLRRHRRSLRTALVAFGACVLIGLLALALFPREGGSGFAWLGDANAQRPVAVVETSGLVPPDNGVRPDTVALTPTTLADASLANSTEGDAANVVQSEVGTEAQNASVGAAPRTNAWPTPLPALSSEQATQVRTDVLAAYNCVRSAQSLPALTIDPALMDMAEQVVSGAAKVEELPPEVARYDMLPLDSTVAADGCAVGGMNVSMLPSLVDLSALGIAVRAENIPNEPNAVVAVVLAH